MQVVSENKNHIEQDTGSNLKNEGLNLLAEAVNLLSKSMNKFSDYTIQRENQREVLEKREKRSGRIDRWGISIITLVGVCLGVSATMHQTSVENALKRKFQHQQDVQTQISQEIQSLDSQIHNKTLKRDNLNIAMSQARNLLEVSHLYCKDNKFSGDEIQYGEKQLNNIYQMVNAVYAIYQIFDQHIQDRANYFLKSYDKNRKNCGQEDYDEELRLLQGQINRLMNVSIALDQQKKEELSKKLINSSQIVR